MPHVDAGPNDPSASQLVYELVRRMGMAELNRDFGFLKNLLADELTFRRASGAVVDKAGFLEDLVNPANTFDALEQEAIAVRILEGIALVTLVVHASGSRGGAPFAGSFRNIRIFMHEPDRQPEWRLHAWFNHAIQK